MSDEKMWAMVVIVGICSACACTINGCRGNHREAMEGLRQQAENARTSAIISHDCVAAGGDLLQGNCIRRAK